MAWAQETIVRWDQKILPIWLRRLVRLTARESGDRKLSSVFELCDATASSIGWALECVVPLEQDRQGHEWAAVACTATAQRVIAHGLTPAGAFAELYGVMVDAQ